MTRRRVVLVSSSGGVLLDLLALRPWWSGHDTSWIAPRAADTTVALAGQRVHWWPELPVASRVRALPGAVRAAGLLRRECPDAVVSAGDGLAVGVFLAARALRIPTIYVETLTGAPSRAGRICASLATAVLTQRADRVGDGVVLIGELY